MEIKRRSGFGTMKERKKRTRGAEQVERTFTHGLETVLHKLPPTRGAKLHQRGRPHKVELPQLGATFAERTQNRRNGD